MVASIDTAELLLSHFRGRADYVAVGTPHGDKVTFAPLRLDRSLPADWLATRHLSGSRCLGFYLMTPESKVYCACVDFDNKPDNPDPEWKAKTEAVHLWLGNAGLSPLTEVSSSGNGAHVWLFFEEPTDAWIPRAWFSLVSEKTGIPFREVYPRQDVLSGKGLGNLVRYPLWNNSRFVDPEQDWAILTPAKALHGVLKTAGYELQALALEMGKPLERRQADTSRVPPPAPDGSLRLPPRVEQRLKRQGSLLQRRWEGDMTGLNDPSRSALALSIATELVRQYVTTDEIKAALRVWCKDRAYDKGDRPEWIDMTTSKAYELVSGRMEERSTSITTLESSAYAYLDTIERGTARYVPTGLVELDQSIEGAAFGEMVVVAARPGHGKSAFALQWLDSAALSGMKCLLISEEMSALELGKRTVTYVANLPSQHWCPASVPNLREEIAAHYKPAAPVYVVENCNTIDRADDVINENVALHGVQMVAVDYLQLLGGNGQKRYDQVTDVSRRLKQSAKRNNVVLLALCQLNREIESRGKFEPQLSDLRESGQLEQDCDLAIFLAWPHRVDATCPENDYMIYVKKRRNGPVKQAKIETGFDATRQSIGRQYRKVDHPFTANGKDHL